LKAITESIRCDGGTAECCALDVTRLDDVQAFVAFAVERFGRIDVLVNNAGVMPISRLDELHVDEWNRMIDVNIRGVLHGIAAVLPMMRNQGFGQIINLSSDAARAIHPTGAVYSATKSAVNALSEGLRVENDKIRVTVITPGITASELAETISVASVRQAMKQFRRQAMAPENVARAIAFAIEQPSDVDVSEIVVRPTACPY
jgi:NADP-dependent 3-hydroxy acid dehydrogenase YdfG